MHGNQTYRYLLRSLYQPDPRDPEKVQSLSKFVIAQIASGLDHIVVITSMGWIYTWGDNRFGKTGHGRKIKFLASPKHLSDLSEKTITSVSAGCSHTACVCKSGQVYTWGRGDNGLLGHGDTQHQYIPKHVDSLTGVKVKQSSCGGAHTALCSESGEVYTFGKGEFGQLGHGDVEDMLLPTTVKALDGKVITQVECASQHTVALTTSGYVYTWGREFHGSLGQGLRSEKSLTIPCLIEDLREHNVVKIGCCAAIVDPTPSSVRDSQSLAFSEREKNSDITFIIEKQHIHANMDVLSKRSAYFRANNSSKEIDVPNCSAETFTLLIKFLYMDSLTVNIYQAVELYQLACTYQLDGLKYLCMATLENNLSIDNAVVILKRVIDYSSCDGLKKICVKFVSEKYNVIRSLKEEELVETLPNSLLLEIEQKRKEGLTDDYDSL
jgi:hypothetical protein